MVLSINKSLASNRGNGRATSPPPIDSRRAAIIVNNVIGMHAVSTARRERGNIKSDALLAFRHSMVDTLSSEHGGIEDVVIETAHDTHRDILEDAQDPVITQIEREMNVVKRVALAYTLGATPEDVSTYTSAALAEIQTSKGDEAATAFAYAMLSRLRSAPPGEAARLNRTVFDELYPLVLRAMRAATDRPVDVTRVMVKDASFETLVALLSEVETLSATPAGRVALTISALPYDTGLDASSTGAPDSVRRRVFETVRSRIKTINLCVAEYARDLSPIGQPASGDASPSLSLIF